MRWSPHGMVLNRMDLAQVEFLAEEEVITIVPNFSHGKIYLISGDVGPFVPSIPVEVPLWLALNLRQQQKCRIIPPEWMTTEKLEDKKQEETDSQVFTKMACNHFREMTQLLLSVAGDDIPNGDVIQTLVKDIWDIRSAKLRSSMDAFIKSDETHAEVDNLTVMEINTIRSMLTGSLNLVHRLQQGLMSTVNASLEDTQD